MSDVSAKSSRFWDTVSEHVTTKVARVRNQGGAARASVIAYLRDLEAVARRDCPCRDTIQIIASGRHLLGDRDEVPPADAMSARARSPRRTTGGNSHRETNVHE